MAKEIFKKNSNVTFSGRPIKIARKNVSENSLIEANVLSADEVEMDRRAKSATRAAIKKARVCNAPVARYDVEKKKAFLEYADGSRIYVE